MTKSLSFAPTDGWMVPALTIFLVGVQQSAFLVHLSVFADQVLHLDPSNLALLVFSFHASAMLSSVALTWMSDHVGHRMRLFGALCGFSLVGYGCLMLVGGVSAAAAVLVFCIGPTASQNALLFAHLRAEDGPLRRIIFVRAAFSAAWVVGPAIGAAVWGSFSGMGLLTLLAGISCVLAPITLTFRPAARSAAAVELPASTHWFGLGLAFFAFAFLQGTTTGALTIVPLVLGKELPAGGSAGLLFSLCALIEVPALIVLGKTAERFGALRVLIFGCACGATYYLVLWNARSEWPLYAAQLLNAFFIAAIVGPGLVWFQNLAPDRIGLSTALFLSAYNTGGLMITPLIGWVAMRTGTYQSVATAFAIIAVTGGALLATVSVHRSNAGEDVVADGAG
jgi:SET family sugar efflux transporter-like MFS transporter